MYTLGIKLTCAFELLASSPLSWSERVVELWNAEKVEEADDMTIKKWDENYEEPDNEEWMTLSSDDVKRIMAEDKTEEEQIKEMIATMSAMMERESGFEGIDDEYVFSWAS